jgi:D-mannonate dehydratase
MKLAMVSRPLADADLHLAVQMGMSDVVSTVPGISMAPQREQGPALALKDLQAMQAQVQARGLRLSVIEGWQLSDRITLGLPGRDDDIARVCESIENMGRAGASRSTATTSWPSSTGCARRWTSPAAAARSSPSSMPPTSPPGS